MSETLRISLVQADLIWEHPQANLDLLSKLLENTTETDLIILPEMFSTGFTMQAQAVAEKPDGLSVNWMLEIAKKKKAAVTGSLVIEEDGAYFNRLFFITPDGKIYTYNKKHLFTLAGEHRIYTPGNNRLVVDYNGWRICPLVCYDLRFPVWARNTENYDLLIYVANWPQVRVFAWDRLLCARAIENMSYVAGVNRVGSDGNGHPYTGHSAVYDGLGQDILPVQINQQGVFSVTLKKTPLAALRSKLRFLDDRDSYEFK